MNTTIKGLIFGAVVAVAMTVTFDSVTAAEQLEVVRLDAVQVTAHADHFDTDGNLKAAR